MTYPWAYSDPIDGQGMDDEDRGYQAYPPEPTCNHCGQGMFWEGCGACEDGYSYHDCGEDTCCCADPEPNVVCEQCGGNSGWWTCINAACPLRNKQ